MVLAQIIALLEPIPRVVNANPATPPALHAPVPEPPNALTVTLGQLRAETGPASRSVPKECSKALVLVIAVAAVTTAVTAPSSSIATRANLESSNMTAPAVSTSVQRANMHTTATATAAPQGVQHAMQTSAPHVNLTCWSSRTSASSSARTAPSTRHLKYWQQRRCVPSRFTIVFPGRTVPAAGRPLPLALLATRVALHGIQWKRCVCAVSCSVP